MPYAANSDLPDGVRHALPAAAQTIYRKAFNNAIRTNDEDSAHKIAWSAVKHGYHKVGDNWVAKETVMQEALSASDKRLLLQSAINERFPHDSIAYPHSPTPWVRDVFDDSVVYDLGGSLFQVSYTMSDEGKVELGDDTKKVFAQTQYTAIESLRTAYTELVQTVGERGIADANEFIEVSHQCMLILEAETPDLLAAVDALEAVETAMEWVKAQEATKTEDGQSYPSSAFAYVPDADKPSGWKLRLWEDPEKKVTRKQLGAAAAAFSSGGFRGQRVQLPANAVAGVKAKIRAAYRRLGVATEDIPKSVMEVEMRERLSESFTIAIEEVTEGGIAEGLLPVRIIVPGFNSSKSRHYSESAIADAGRIFEGSKMYADHQTEAQEEAMPERSIRDWVATLQETKISESGNAVGMAHIHAGWLKEMVTNLHEAGNLGQLGTSINCLGKGSKQTIEGTDTIAVEGLERGTFGSVDFVTEAGAGGQAGLRESAHDSFLDVELVDLATLREARPDLVKGIETAATQQAHQEVKKAMETAEQVKGLEDQVETLTTERDGLQDQIDEAAKDRLKAIAQVAIKDAVDKADLPDAAKNKVLKQLEDETTTDGVEEAIKDQADYIAELNEAGKVRGHGPSAPENDEVAGKAAYKEALRRQHPEWTDKELDDAAR